MTFCFRNSIFILFIALKNDTNINPNYELLALTKGFPFFLPGNVGPAWHDLYSTVHRKSNNLIHQIAKVYALFVLLNNCILTVCISRKMMEMSNVKYRYVLGFYGKLYLNYFLTKTWNKRNYLLLR